MKYAKGEKNGGKIRRRVRRKSKQFQISCKTLPGFTGGKREKDRMERISVKK